MRPLGGRFELAVTSHSSASLPPRLSLPQRLNSQHKNVIRIGQIRSIHIASPSQERHLSNLPQQLDLLQRYQGLVASGTIRHDDEQIRVIMQLRRMQKELIDYAPPALVSHYLKPEQSRDKPDRNEPWWTTSEAEEDGLEIQALVRVRTHAEEIEALTTPKGLLLTGPPGCGKSFLIDMWLAALPTPFKTRKHYNELVLEIYRAVWEETRRRMSDIYHPRPEDGINDEQSPAWSRGLREQWRELLKTSTLPLRWKRRPWASSSSAAASQPPIAFVVAQRLLVRHWLLVFDEIQLLDVSSATLLADVLSWFWRMGGVVVGTSNKVPDDLYKNGVQRERLEPFVEALKARCPIHTMLSEQDFRAARASNGSTRTWFTMDRKDEFETALRAMCGDGVEARPYALTIFGRSVHVPWATDDTCKFSFSELCDESLGPADYMTLASTYRTVAITSITVLKLSAKNQARRFISLIDALYEARCRIVCLAEAEPEDIFFPDASSTPEHSSRTLSATDVDVMHAETISETQDVYRPNVSSYDAPNMSEAREAPSAPLALDTLSIFSGKEEQFAFKRALSRLLEMTCERYIADEQWNPLPPASRRWERTAEPHPSASLSKQPHLATSPLADGRDSSNPFPGRPASPRLHESHFWGVRDDAWHGATDVHRDAGTNPATQSGTQRDRTRLDDPRSQSPGSGPGR